jgi:mycothiol synthase
VQDHVEDPDIILVWPHGRAAPATQPVDGYVVQALPRARDAWWVDVHRQAVPAWGEAQLRLWLERYRSLALQDGILVATDGETGAPAATAGSIAHDRDGLFPGGGQLAWVATVPAHRGRGLATWLSALATARLCRDGFTNIFLCTGDDLTAAIRVYLRLGYLPCLYASDQPKRWARICAAIGHPFEPVRWPTREAYVKR